MVARLHYICTALNGWHYVLWLKAYKEKNSFTQICNWKREVLVSSRKCVGNLGSSDHAENYSS